MDNDLIRLTADYYNGTLDDAGARRLAALIASSPEAASSFKAELQRLGSASSDGEAVVLLNNSRSANRKKAIRRGIIGSAGAFAVLVVCLLVLLRPTSPEVEERTVAMIDKQDGEMLSSEVSGREYRIPEAERQEGFVYCAPADSKMTVSLSDGTEIVLNKGSKLLLDADFGKLDRNVSLDGEAFFKVAPDKEKVFRIACGNETFVVKGTSFNIMSYSEDKFSVVTLHTGSLAAHIKNDTIILDPGDELRVDEGEDNISRRKVDVRNSTRWMDGDALHFSSLPLKMVALKIGHKYGIRLSVHPSLSDILYDGVIDDEPLEVALRLLAITAPEKITVNRLNDKDYYITKQ